MCLFCCGGCITKKPTGYRISPVVLASPVIPRAATADPIDPPPDISSEIAEVPPPLTTPRSGPARPKVAAPPPAEPVIVEKPADPVIVPDLTSDELNIAKRDAQKSLDTAEANLAKTQGKPLNAAQQDVVSKIRGFMESSRDAMKASDWARARNLAKKAEVLSREVVENP